MDKFSAFAEGVANNYIESADVESTGIAGLREAYNEIEILD